MSELYDRYSALSTQNKLIILCVLGCATAYFSYIESVESAQTALTDAKAADEQLMNDLEKHASTGQSITALETQKIKAEEEFSALLELVPKDVEVEKLLASFANSANDSGVAMVKFAPLPPSQQQAASNQAPPPTKGGEKNETTQSALSKDSFQRVTINVSLEGTFPQITSFFDKVLSLPRVVRIETFKMEPGTQLVSVPIANAGVGAKTQARTSYDGSPILKAESQFVAFSQNGKLPDFSVFNAPPASSPTPVPISSTESSPAGLSAKPLNEGEAP
jgi:Tfp pilus assembly protein PilO